jgi:NADH-quinone oxidoreductase subunit J
MLSFSPPIGAAADYAGLAFFVLLAGLAIGAALAVVTQRNPLYSAISLVFVFVALAGLYLTLAAPFIAAIQVIVYAGAIMVLVVFVIMLLNVEEPILRTRRRLRFLMPAAVALAALLFAEAAFIIYHVHDAPFAGRGGGAPSNTGLSESIGAGLFTTYLLPFEITSLLILMAIVGAMTLARRASPMRPTDLVVPGAAVLPRQAVTAEQLSDATPVVAHTTAEVERTLGLAGLPHRKEDDGR